MPAGPQDVFPALATVSSSLPHPAHSQLPNLDEYLSIPNLHPSILPGPCPALPLLAALAGWTMEGSHRCSLLLNMLSRSSNTLSRHRSEHILILFETLRLYMSDSRFLRVQIL